MRLLIIAVVLLFTTVAEAPKMILTKAMWNMTEERIKKSLSKYDKMNSVYNYLIETKWFKEEPAFHNQDALMVVSNVYSAHKEFDLPIPLIMAIIEVESSWRPDVVSHKGARGLMQIMPVWDETLIDEGIIETPEQIFDIARNIRSGCWILRDYLNVQDRGFMSIYNINRALDRYSGGGGQEYIGKVKDAMKRIKEFMNAI